VPKLWLKTLDAFIQKHNPEMIIAPVTYSVSNTFFEQFQLLDFLSLQSATIAGFGIGKPFLCNGANLTYKKEEFKLLKGFEGNTNIASGDDIFLMEKFLIKHPKKIMCLKSLNALVSTKSQDSVTNLIQQRIRWAAKTASYNNSFGKLVGLFVLSMNAIIISLAIFTILNIIKFEILIFIFIVKFFFNLFLIHKSAHFFNQKLNIKSYIISSFLYPFFSVYIAVKSMFFGFKWKERSFKQ
jgi:cellulose synthase/poly-beta-1,6-N-acetylglucosamine synthase-like glycosyltransferase